MARSVYERARGRGFPAYNFAGQTGEGALPDSSAPPARAGLPVGKWTDPNQDPGSVPAALPPPEAYQLGVLMWGLSGAPNPDTTPRTHAAPIADPTLAESTYVDEAFAAHAPVFNGPAVRQPITLGEMRQTRHGGQGSRADVLQPVTGQIRANAGFDAVQGYGGGGKGPGGVNEPQGPVTDVTAYGGETYNGSPGTFVSAAETPFLTADSRQFIASAPEFPSYMPTYDVPTASVHAQDAVGADVPAQGAPVAASVPTYVQSFW